MTVASPKHLLEREHEIARLTAVIEQAAAGAGGAVMVEGAAGIGKTSLLDVAAAIAADRDLRVLRARGGELEAALAFGVTRDLLARRIAAAPKQLRARLVTGAAAVALPALGLAQAEGLPAEEAAINHGLTWLVSDLAEEEPLALIVDDVQWADAASVAWLAHLARRLADLPIVLLLGARPPGSEPEAPGMSALREQTDLERMQPSPLGLPSVAALVRSFYAADADDAFVTACHGAAGGNPFSTQALLDAAAAQEISPTAAGADALAELAPDAVRRFVAAALRRAGAAAAKLAKASAILGEMTEPRHAAALAELDMPMAEATADRLADQGLLEPGRPLRFVHPVLLAAVRGGTPAGERARLHRGAAAMFQREGDARRAAAHLLEVAPAGDQDVVATLLAAAREAAAEGAVVHASRLLDRALAEPPPAGGRPALLGLLGRARMWGHTGDAVRPLLAAADAATTVEERAQLLATAAWATLWEEPELIGEVARRVAELPPDPGEGRMRADATMATTLRLSGLPPDPPTPELLARAETLPGNTPAQRELLAAAAFTGLVEGAAPASLLVELARRAMLDPEQTPAPAAMNASQVIAFAGFPDEALAMVDLAMAGCQRRGNQTGLAGLYVGRCFSNWWPGRFREAEVDARTVWAMTRDVRVARIWSVGRFAMLLTFAARGLVDEAARFIESNPPSAALAGWDLALTHWMEASIALEAGETGRAVELSMRVETGLTTAGLQATTWGMPHRPTAIEALVRSGDPERARPFAEEELRLARTLEAPGTLGYALRCMGLVVGGDEGRALLEEAVALLERSGERDRLARTLIDLGRAIRVGGEPTEAREPLRRASELAEACGAELVAKRAADELRAAGAKPRRRALSGPESLTPSEARVAQRAAEGLTNREIAQELFVSTKTVETHLGHIYGKLDIRGRSELAAALTEPRPAG